MAIKIYYIFVKYSTMNEIVSNIDDVFLIIFMKLLCNKIIYILNIEKGWKFKTKIVAIFDANINFWNSLEEFIQHFL